MAADDNKGAQLSFIVINKKCAYYVPTIGLVVVTLPTTLGMRTATTGSSTTTTTCTTVMGRWLSRIINKVNIV